MSRPSKKAKVKRNAQKRALEHQAKREEREAKNGLIGKVTHSPALKDVSFSRYRTASVGAARMVQGGAPGSGKRK